ncbi:hypothetical protein LBMAG42_08600 [Deltaproteobacteria bacterium]|nr:hypothetical protein LBMAG42_08600 [Deltaproteobacteria bacterium]
MGPHGLTATTRTQRLARPALCLVPQAPPVAAGLVPEAIVAFQIASRRAAGLVVAAGEASVQVEQAPLFAGEEPTLREERPAGAAALPEPTPEAVMVAAPHSHEPAVSARPAQTVVPRVSLDDLEDWFTGEI